MRKNNNLFIGIIMIVLIVSASGCISTNETKTFSDGSMSFSYPTDFENATYSENDTNSTFPMEIIAYFENTAPLRVHNIMVFKNMSPISSSEKKNLAISRIQDDSACKILSSTNETNPNGVFVEKLSYSYEYTTSVKVIYSEMYFEVNNEVYSISIFGPDTTIGNQVINETTQTIFQSIRGL